VRFTFCTSRINEIVVGQRYFSATLICGSPRYFGVSKFLFLGCRWTWDPDAAAGREIDRDLKTHPPVRPAAWKRICRMWVTLC